MTETFIRGLHHGLRGAGHRKDAGVGGGVEGRYVRPRIDVAVAFDATTFIDP